MSLGAARLCFFALPLGRPICARLRHATTRRSAGTAACVRADLGCQIGRHGFSFCSARRLICGDDVAALTLIVGTKTAEQVRSPPDATCNTHRATRSIHHMQHAAHNVQSVRWRARADRRLMRAERECAEPSGCAVPMDARGLAAKQPSTIDRLRIHLHSWFSVLFFLIIEFQSMADLPTVCRARGAGAMEGPAAAARGAEAAAAEGVRCG